MFIDNSLFSMRCLCIATLVVTVSVVLGNGANLKHWGGRGGGMHGGGGRHGGGWGGPGGWGSHGGWGGGGG